MTEKEQILEMYQIMYDAIHMQKCPKENTDCEFSNSRMDCDECIACYALYNAGYRKNIEMKEYKYNFGDEVIITYGKLRGIHSTIIHRENGDNYLEPLYKVSCSKLIIPQSHLELYKSKCLEENPSEMIHSFELLATEIYKSENKEVINAFEQFCKETDVKITKEIYLNNKSIIKKETK